MFSIIGYNTSYYLALIEKQAIINELTVSIYF
jgi:hypothetical protein